jgi:GNAT superfamily N-acetyltransferase
MTALSPWPPFEPGNGHLPPPPHGPRRVPLPRPHAAPLPVIQADDADLIAVTAVIATAFVNLSQSKWIVPDERARAATFHAWTAMQVHDAITHGVVHAWATTGRHIRGAALWTWAPGHGSHPDPAEYDTRLIAATGNHVDRYRRFERTVEDHAQPHGAAQVHLWMIGVHPNHRDQGIGSALLQVMHGALDDAGYTAYLEAADQRSQALYRRHGYHDAGPPYHLPEHGPAFYPMLRPPQPTTSP